MNRVLRGGLSALGCLLAAAVVVVAIPAPHAAEPVTVSYRGYLVKLARLDGRTWNLSATPARGQRSMYVTSPAGFTVVVTGNATWADLRLLAASLRPVTPGN